MALIERIKARLIDDWQKAHRLWSVRLSAVALTAFSFISAFPETALSLWNSLPADVRAAMPHGSTISAVAFAGVLILRLTRQAKPNG